jgi:hypothetical protein
MGAKEIGGKRLTPSVFQGLEVGFREFYGFNGIFFVL